MSLKLVYQRDRVDDAAAFIAEELKTLLDRGRLESHIARRLAEACPAWKHGLTNCERLLATLRALSMVQLAVAADMATLIHDTDDDELDPFDADEVERRWRLTKASIEGEPDSITMQHEWRPE